MFAEHIVVLELHRFFWQQSGSNHAASVFCSVIEHLQESVKNQNALIGKLREKEKDQDQPIAEQVVQLNTLVGQKDAEVQVSYL